MTPAGPYAEAAHIRAMGVPHNGPDVLDAPALDAISAKFEDAGFLLSAADSAAQAATLHQHANRRRKTLDSTARARVLASKCGGAVTPAMQSAQPLTLTYRPRQIPASHLSYDE
jgi:hypothetical protein